MWREIVRRIRVGVIREERNRTEGWKEIKSEVGDERPRRHGRERELSHGQLSMKRHLIGACSLEHCQ